MSHKSMFAIVVSAFLQVACGTRQMDAIPPEHRDDVLITPQSMHTGIDAAAAASGVVGARVSVGVPDSFGNFERDELPRWDGALRLVRWPGRELVPGEWQLGVEGGRYTFVFQPEAETYEEGWYAVQIDFGMIGDHRGPVERDELPVIDGWTTNRFRIGSQPVVRLYGSLTPTTGGLLFQTSEVVSISASRAFSEYLQVVVDNVDHRCTFGSTDVYGPERGFQGVDVECEAVPEDAVVQVTIRDGFFDRAVSDYRGGTPPNWTFRAGEVPDNAGPSDALFVVDVAEGR